MQRGDSTVRQRDPRFIDVNLMSFALKGDNRIVKFVKAPGVAKGAMLHDALETFCHGRWGGEIHIGNPQRDKAFRHITKARADKGVIPFSTPVAFTLNDFVKIKHHTPLLN